MKLITLVGKNAYKFLKENNYYAADETKSPLLNEEGGEDFVRAYDWLSQKMAKVITKPKDIKYPVWCWPLDYTDLEFIKEGEEGGYLIFMEVPNELCFATGFEYFNCIINNWPVIPDSVYDTLAPEEIEVLENNQLRKEETWDTYVPQDYADEHSQVTIWEILPEYILDIQAI